ncbi:MAG TPA: RNA polymerase sigma factor [Solirubrobacteraceae bacterium]|nr:RNA polymerase sigma factor [Solirubrobacteraceae bacterium]
MSIDDEASFEAGFRRFSGHVHAYALRRTDREAAQEVTAETFLIAWRRRAQAPSEPLPWLYGIARGVLANERRASMRRGALLGRLAEHSRGPAEAAEGREVLRALALLPARDSELLLLVAWEGLSTKEAAAVLGCSAATLAVRLHRARRRLARALAEIAERPEAQAQPRQVSEVSA